MKRLIFCLIALIATFVVASARDVGVQLQTEAPPGTQFTPTNYTAINQMETLLAELPAYCNPDYGSYAQVSVNKSIVTDNITNAKCYTYNRICTARHVTHN